jgi:transcription termination factor Rho
LQRSARVIDIVAPIGKGQRALIDPSEQTTRGGSILLP